MAGKNKTLASTAAAENIRLETKAASLQNQAPG
jgi:hypothetical protein